MPRILPGDTFDLEGVVTAHLGGLDRTTDLYRCARGAVRHCRTTKGAKGYAYVLGQFLEYTRLHSLDPFTMTKDDLEDWRDSMSSVASSTREQNITVIRTFYREAEERELVQMSPARRLSEGRHSNTSSPPALSLDQAKLLVASIRAEFDDPRRFLVARRVLCAVLFALKLGLRATEMRRVQFADLDVTSPITSMVVLGKERSQVRMKLPADVIEAVRDFRFELERVGVKVYDFDPVVISLGVVGIPQSLRRRTKEPLPVLSEPNLYLAIRQRLEAIGVTGKKVGPHRLRKTAATIAWLNSRDLLLVQRLMRHSDPNTTVQHYVKPSDDLEFSGSDYIDLT